MVASLKPALILMAHGLGSCPFAMRPLERELVGEGFEVVHYSYRSRGAKISIYAEEFAQLLREIDSERKIHLVTHSMGCLIARAALAEYCVSNPGRMVMLGPPNRGSFIARQLYPRFHRFCPALREMSDEDDSYVNSLPEPGDFEVGIIAAELDRVIKRTHTHLDCEQDHTVVRGHHFALPWKEETYALVSRFLRMGRFE